MVSFSFRARIDYRSLSCTRIDRIPLSSESLSRQSTQSTVYTAIPGYPVSYGKILKWYPDTLLAMGKLLRRVPGDLLARYSGTMQRIFCSRAAAAAAAAAVPHRSSSTSSYSYSCRLQSVDIEQ